jgi:streptomycin adenylyltransferase
LFAMGTLFDELAKGVGLAMSFRYNEVEANNVIEYLNQTYKT